MTLAIVVPSNATPRQRAVAAFLNASLLLEARRLDLEAKLDELVAAHLDFDRASLLVEQAHRLIAIAPTVERQAVAEQRQHDVLEGLSDGERAWLEAVA